MHDLDSDLLSGVAHRGLVDLREAGDAERILVEVGEDGRHGHADVVQEHLLEFGHGSREAVVLERDEGL